MVDSSVLGVHMIALFVTLSKRTTFVPNGKLRWVTCAVTAVTAQVSIFKLIHATVMQEGCKKVQVMLY